MNAALSQLKAEVEAARAKEGNLGLLMDAPRWLDQLMAIAIAQDRQLEENDATLREYANETGQTQLFFDNLELCRNVIRQRNNPHGFDLNLPNP